MKAFIAAAVSLVVATSSDTTFAMPKKPVKVDPTDTTVIVVNGRNAPKNSRVFNNGNLLTITITESGNLRTLANGAGYDGESLANILFVVPAGTTIMGKAGDGRGIDTGRWPAGVTLGLAVNGRVCGGGGKGGDGWGQAGGGGGDAIYVQAPIMVVVAEKAAVEGGGGGGARSYGGNGAGGGGGGFPNGTYGMGMGNGDSGRGGHTSGGGRGGNNRQIFKGETSIPPFDRGITAGTSSLPGLVVTPGGNGGDPGMDGDAVINGGGGGTAGYAVRGNGYPVNLVVAGRIRGKTE